MCRVPFIKRLHLLRIRIQCLSGMSLVACDDTTISIETTIVEDILTISTEDVNFSMYRQQTNSLRKNSQRIEGT